MYNQVTDRYRLVQMKIVNAPPVFGRTISSVDNYSLEVFRGDVHLGSVGPRSSQPASKTKPKPVGMKVNDGDIIYWVNILPHPVPIVGSFTTLDNFVRIYDVTLDLVVSDPVLFVQGYRLGKDPVKLAIEVFTSAFQKYAAKTEHDKLKILRPPDDTWNNSLSADTGMKIAQISQSTFRDDPVRLQMAAMQQDAGKDQLAISIKAENQRLEDNFQRIRDSNRRFHERRELEIQRKFEREEEERQHLHERRELEVQRKFEREEEGRQHLYERRELERQSEFEREEEERQFKYEVGKRERQRDFEREEDARQHMFDLHYQLRVAAAQELKEILRERIRDAYDRGKPIDGVAEESLKLLTAFHESLHRGYVFSTSSNGSSTSANGTSPDADTISSDEDTTTEHEATTDPLNVPPNLSDLSGKKQKEAGKE